MDRQKLVESIDSYKNQLLQIESALTTAEEADKQDLLTLKNDIKHLIELTEESLSRLKSENEENEFALFMSEMEKEGAVTGSTSEGILNELQSIEGMKCRAPHTHKWGDTMYHNAVVCSAPLVKQSYDELKVKVMFINPTHQEMLPCPFLMDSDCKFSDEQCKYSHGEMVLFSSLQEYSEPIFEAVTLGSCVLAKQNNRLWGRAVVKQLSGIKCWVKFDCSQADAELELHDVVPLNDVTSDEVYTDSESDTEQDDIINTSLMNTAANQPLGDWEKHTKGIASKIMQRMGYVIGTGLGPLGEGRIEPVPTVILPPGKSLDHCMKLRENAGGDKDLFNVEKKLKRLQKKRELQNQKAYEREKKKVNVFNFLNEKLLNTTNDKPNLNRDKSKHRLDVKKETSRNLNVASVKIDEDIRKIETELTKIRESLTRHSDVHSQMHKGLKQKLFLKQTELQSLKDKAVNISHEQSARNSKKKLTVF